MQFFALGSRLVVAAYLHLHCSFVVLWTAEIYSVGGMETNVKQIV